MACQRSPSPASGTSSATVTPPGLDFAEGWIENTATGQRLAGGALPPMVPDILAAGGILPMLAREGYLPQPATP